MKQAVSILAIAVLAMSLAATPARAEMSDRDKAAAAAAAAALILGVAALAHHKHHYKDGYEPSGGEETAAFERGYRDALHGHDYNTNHSTKAYAEGYQAGDRERANSTAYRRRDRAREHAPHEATKGCARIVARNFAVDRHQVHIVNSRPEVGDTWLVEAAVGHSHMVCRMSDSGDVIEVRGDQRL